MDNKLYLTKSSNQGDTCIAIGSINGSRRRVWLTHDQVMKLAYRLMSLGSGGNTLGVEEQETS